MRRFPDRTATKPGRGAAASALRIAGTSAGVALVAAAALATLSGPKLQALGLDSPLALLRDGALAMTKPQRLRVESLDQLRKTVFFDAATHEPKAWYAVSRTGELELFTAPGRHPDRKETLKPVTTAVVQQLERRLKSEEQERVAAAERRAATARANAEIARARRAQASALPMPAPRDTPVRQATTSPGGVPTREVPVVEATGPAASSRRGETPVVASVPPISPPPSTRDGSTFALPGPPSVARRADPDAAPINEEAARARQYNELVFDARALIDAGRYGEARAKAQRAIFVDPQRVSARTLWAEAQAKLDQATLSTFTRRPPATRWPY